MTSPFAIVNATWLLALSESNITADGLAEEEEDLCASTGNSSRPDHCLFADIRRIVEVLDFYLLPVIASVGSVGNLLSFLVFTATYLHRLSSSIYLAALAIVDTVFLVVMLFSWLTVFGIQVRQTVGCC